MSEGESLFLKRDRAELQFFTSSGVEKQYAEVGVGGGREKAFGGIRNLRIQKYCSSNG